MQPKGTVAAKGAREVRGRRPAGLAWRLLGALALGGAAVVGLAATQLGRPPRPAARASAVPDIVLVVVDCLRRDHLGAYGYARPTSPRLDQLAAEGMRFTRAYSTAAWTKPAIASLLTGRYPHRHRTLGATDRLGRGLATLAERLGEAGYETAFLNGGNAFIGDRFGFERGFDAYVFEADHRAERLNARLAAWLEEVPEGRPVFAYLHYMDLHLPYHRNEFNTLFARDLSGAPEALRPEEIRVGPIREATAALAFGPRERQLVIDLYDGQIRYLDRQLERLVALLEDSGRWPHTVLLVTGDHGEEFWEHGNYEHGHSLYEEVIRIPMIVAGRGIPRATVHDPVSLLDLHATVSSLAGLEPDPDSDAVDLLARRPGARGVASREALAVMGTLYGGEKAAVLEGSRKVIRNTPPTRDKWTLVGQASARALEIYDLASDPHERDDLAPADAALAARWHARLDAWIEGVRAGAPGQQEIEGELRAQLEALGYVQ
jgi:arylsulfatase